jgi:dCTP deaminase
MATIVDFQIEALGQHGLIQPFRRQQVNPASYDVTLGPKILVEEREGWREVDISIPGFEMMPGAFILAHTAEVINVPDHLECIFQLKSSRGREGYEHALAGYIDPGFSGQVTLELTNLNRYHWLPLEAGMRIGQLRFSRVDETPLRPYGVTGRYNRDMGVVPSKG